MKLMAQLITVPVIIMEAHSWAGSDPVPALVTLPACLSHRGQAKGYWGLKKEGMNFDQGVFTVMEAFQLELEGFLENRKCKKKKQRHDNKMFRKMGSSLKRLKCKMCWKDKKDVGWRDCLDPDHGQP